MASESTEEASVSVTLSAELHEWLGERASERNVAAEDLLVQLLTSYREAATFDGAEAGQDLELHLLGEDDVESIAERCVDTALDDGAVTEDDLEEAVETAINEALEDALADHVSEQVAESLDAELTDRLSEATSSLQKQLENRIDTVENDFQGKLEDVRERVIQVKRETDTKAPADHGHDALEVVDDLRERFETVERDFETLRDAYEETVPDQGDQVEELSQEFQEIQDRLQTVAWVVNDLRDAHESAGGLDPVDRIKRAAAKADIDRARCENCGDGVEIALLTDPKCPHCDATVSNVEPKAGWFDKPTLLVASQLEAGSE